MGLWVDMTRTVGYIGFVMLAGGPFFRAWVSSNGRIPVVLIRMTDLGGLIVIVTTVALQTRSASPALSGWPGVCIPIRIALVLVAVVGLVPLLVHSPRPHRVLVGAWLLAFIETYVVPSDAWTEPWRVVKVVATTAHLGATAAWLGGLLALAVVVIPGEDTDILHRVLPRFSPVATVSVIVLVVTGVVHAAAVVGWRGLVHGSYGQALAVKLTIFAVMLLLGNIGRRYTHRLGQTSLVVPIGPVAAPRTATLAVAIGAEFALATGVLAATSVLAAAAPPT